MPPAVDLIPGVPPWVEWLIQIIAGPITGALAALLFGLVRDCRAVRLTQQQAAAELAMDFALALQMIENLDAIADDAKMWHAPRLVVPRGVWWNVRQTLSPRLKKRKEIVIDIELFYRNAHELDVLAEQIFQLRSVADRDPSHWGGAVEAYFGLVRALHSEKGKFGRVLEYLQEVAMVNLSSVRSAG